MGFGHKTPTNLHLITLLFLLHTHPVFPQNKPSGILQNQVLRDSQSQTIVSPGQIFELGFFGPGNSTSRFVGIWYHKIYGQTITWVANRNAPIAGNSGAFSIGINGSLIISDAAGRIYWSTNTSSAGNNLTATLTDTGNLILATVENAGDDSNSIWQSCHHPTDTYLPNLRIYLKITQGDSHKFVSWKNPNDPSQGDFAMGIDPQGSPQIVVWDQDSGGRIWRSGHWNYQIFTGVPNMRSLLLLGFRLIPVDGGVMYFIFNNPNSTLLMRFLIQWNGTAQQLTWDHRTARWNAALTQPSTDCEKYNKCGGYGICRMKGPIGVCGCMQGFDPISRNQSDHGDFSGGCSRRSRLQCSSNGSTSDGFSRRTGVKLPDFASAMVAGSREKCEEGCLRNCSCDAYAYLSGVGCLIWGDSLVDVEQFEEGGETLFIRLASSDLASTERVSKTAIIAISVAGSVVLGVIIWLLWRFRKKLKECCRNLCGRKKTLPPSFDWSNGQETPVENEISCEGKQCEVSSLPLYSLSTVEVATENFANKNKLGQGGFGPVHKESYRGVKKLR